jgi:hypothetical protein
MDRKNDKNHFQMEKPFPIGNEVIVGAGLSSARVKVFNFQLEK